MVLPDLDNKLNNYDWLIPYSQGCQFIAMKFQNVDNYLISYLNLFMKNKNYSFIPKPKILSLKLGNNADFRDGAIQQNTMPLDVQINPPTFYTISGDKIEQNPNENYNALMCGNPNIDYSNFKPLSVLYYKTELPGNIYNEASFSDTTYMHDTFHTCRDIRERSYKFSNNLHINDTDGRIILKN